MLRFFRIGVTKRRDLAVAVEVLEKFDVKTTEMQDLAIKTIHWGLNHVEKDQGLSRHTDTKPESRPPTISDNVS